MRNLGDSFQVMQKERQEEELLDYTDKWFRKLIQGEQYVGDVYSISYETALVLIHDNYRRKVGGISSLSFFRSYAVGQ